MKKDTSLYMFAVMPPTQLSARIHEIREEFAQMFNFRSALKPPVHITLFDPFEIPSQSSQSFEHNIDQIQHWAKLQSPFRIDLSNYNFSNNPEHPVVYVDVVKTASIKKFHANFIDTLTKHRLPDNNIRNFKPHVTIGYRDVTPEVFPKIKEYYSRQTFSCSFVCHAFYLWKHNGSNWQVIKTYFLDGKGEQLTLF